MKVLLTYIIFSLLFLVKGDGASISFRNLSLIKNQQVISGTRPDGIVFYSKQLPLQLQLNSMDNSLLDDDDEPGHDKRKLAISFTPGTVHQAEATYSQQHLANYGRNSNSCQFLGTHRYIFHRVIKV